MEAHIISIVRFMVCFLSLSAAIVAMLKADDNNAMRRLSAVLAAVLIYFNEQIGSMAYLTVVSTLEAAAATASVGFIIAGLVVLMLLPFILVILKLVHS